MSSPEASAPFYPILARLASPAGKNPALARARAAGFYRIQQGAETEGAERTWPKNPEPPALDPALDPGGVAAPEGRVFTDKKGEPY